MTISYKRLWKLLIDKDMKKKDLCEIAGISPASITKMGKGGHVMSFLFSNFAQLIVLYL